MTPFLIAPHTYAVRQLRLWSYGRVPLYLGIAGVSSGTVALAGHPVAHGGEPWLFAGAGALAMAGVTTVAGSHGSNAAPQLAEAGPHYPIALATAGLPLFLAGWTLVPVCVPAAAAQVAFSIGRSRR